MTQPRAVVIVASTRVATGQAVDRTGPYLTQSLRDLGCEVGEPVVVADGEPVRDALVAALADRPGLIVTTGGTGVTGSDLTPEMTRALLERELPGLAEAVRAVGVQGGVPTAVLSRGVAGLVGETVVLNLPGSPGGCRDGVQVLRGVLGHLFAELGRVDGQPHDLPGGVGSEVDPGVVAP